MTIFGIILALGLLIFLSYRGGSVLILAPLTAAVAVILSREPLLASYTQIFMPALGGFLVQYFPLFILGAIFGSLMERSGCATALAHHIARLFGQNNTIAAVVAACAILTYGGVSLFVVAFAVHPIAAALFRQADLPRQLIPATIALGAFTFTMTALPGTPAIQNAIPMPWFGTSPFAAPGIGLVAAVIMGGGGLIWLRLRAGRLIPLPDSSGAGTAFASDTVTAPVLALWRCGLPVVLVILLNYLFAEHLLPALDTGYLALPRFGATSLGAVGGVWSIIAALSLTLPMVVVLSGCGWRACLPWLDEGAMSALAPAFNTASLVGFGAVIAAMPGFALIRDAILGVAPGNPLVSLAIAVNVLAGITGSASGGMSIALQTLGGTYLTMGREAGIDPELLHRITTIATGGLDSLPHNGAVITLLGVCRLTHRESYMDIFVVACLLPVAALIAVILLAGITGSF